MSENYLILRYGVRVLQDEDVSDIFEDASHVVNLVNDCTEFTGVTTHLMSWNIDENEQLTMSFFVEISDSGDDDLPRSLTIFDKAFEIGELYSRFFEIKGGKPSGASNH